MPAPEPGPPVGGLTVIPVTGMAEVTKGADLAGLVVAALAAGPATGRLVDGDVLVVTQKVVSKAEGRIRREDPMIGVHRHDVLIARHRPIGAELALAAVMDWLFLAQALEPRPVGVGAEMLGIADMELVQRRRIGPGPCSLGSGVFRNASRSVRHGRSSAWPGATSSARQRPDIRIIPQIGRRGNRRLRPSYRERPL